MNDDEKRIFIELNGYDPTTREGLIKRIDEFKAKQAVEIQEGIERIRLAKEHKVTDEDGTVFALEIVAHDYANIIHELYAVLGRIVYDAATGSDAGSVANGD